MVKAIFFDIDGTLVSFNTHEMPESAYQALKQLKQNGIRIFIATGRGKDGLGVLRDLEFDGYITLNGQFCYTKDSVIYENTIAREQLEYLVSYLKEHPFPCGFTLRDTKVFNYRDARVDAIHAITENDNHPAGDISHITEEHVYQCMAFISEEEEKELLKHMPDCTSARWHPLFTDISPKGGTKQKGIDHFLAYYGIDLEETMGFGDGGNDLQMLEHVHTAVCMENGAPQVKEKADFITDDADHDGIYKALKHYHLI